MVFPRFRISDIPQGCPPSPVALLEMRLKSDGFLSRISRDCTFSFSMIMRTVHQSLLCQIDTDDQDHSWPPWLGSSHPGRSLDFSPSRSRPSLSTLNSQLSTLNSQLSCSNLKSHLPKDWLSPDCHRHSPSATSAIACWQPNSYTEPDCGSAKRWDFGSRTSISTATPSRSTMPKVGNTDSSRSPAP